MEYRVRLTGELLTLEEVKARNKDKSLPKTWHGDTLDVLGIDEVLDVQPPLNDDPLKVIKRDGAELANGQWLKKYIVADIHSTFTLPDGTVRTKEEQDTAYLEKIKAEQWINIRKTRDNKLKESDWVTIRSADTGVPVSSAWSEYRQALRNITTQVDPFAIVWPVKPTE